MARFWFLIPIIYMKQVRMGVVEVIEVYRGVSLEIVVVVVYQVLRLFFREVLLR